MYGGIDIEETITDPTKMNLPRFFSFLSDAKLLEIAQKKFDLIKFEAVDIQSKREGFHFQALFLRKK